MGCCASKYTGKGGHHRRSPAKPPPPPSLSQKTHLPRPRVTFPPPPEEETVVKEVLSETPLPQRNSPEVRDAGNSRKLRLQDDAPETKILISKLEEAAEIVSEYSEMCSAASGSLSTATTTATDKRDHEVTSGDHREPRWQQRLNADSNRSPAKAQRRRPSAGGVRPPLSRSRSPVRRAQTARPELRSERWRDLSGELRARPRNVGPAGRGGGGGGDSGRSSRSPAPAGRRDSRGGNKPCGKAKRPPVGPESGGGGQPRELGEGKEDMGVGEGKEKVAAEEEDADGATPSEQGNESLIDNPHVSLECFIFL
ncbi:hypothetical protein CDL15_Pgr002801 [Punica granatum]|uniref:Serine/arginine repetitive matrix protein 1-like n=1 Tax=Punica granatum TaxID=22663 RepID=A0A218X1V3_PUNGR|nr:hypothetical protein CDL15_Pgr002801 [Punica granatum]